MTIEQRGLWAEAASIVVLIAGLTAWLAFQLASTAPADIQWSPGFSWALLAAGLVRIFGRKVARELTAPDDGFTDERDRELRTRADALTLNVLSVLAGVPLLLGLFGAERFWMTVSLAAAFLLTALANTLIHIRLYSHG